MPTTCWEMLVRTGFESPWDQISVAVPVAYLAIHRHDLPLARHNLPPARHAAKDMIAIGWGNDYTKFKLSQKAGVAGLNCIG